MANFKFPRTHIADVNPTPNDDKTEGYTVGVRWFNKSARIEFTCVSGAPIGQAVWETQDFPSDDGSIVKLNSELLLVGDERTPDPSEFYGTDTSGNKGWFSFGELIEEQVANIQASHDIYRRLLDSSPFTRCYFNAFGTNETTTLFTTAGGGTYPTYNLGDYSYTVQSGDTLETGNMIVAGGYTKNFSSYIETAVEYGMWYSTNGFTWIAITDPNTITELPNYISTLYLRFIFTSTGEVKSFGAIYQGEKGVLQDFIESSLNIRYYEDIQASTATDGVTASFTTQQGDTGAIIYRERYESMWREGILLSAFVGTDYEKNSVFLNRYNLRTPQTFDAGERVSVEEYLDETDTEIYYIERNAEVAQAANSISLSEGEFAFTPGNNEVLLWINGILQAPSTLTEATGIITFGDALSEAGVINVRKWVTVGGDNVRFSSFELNASSGQKIIALPFSYTASNNDTPPSAARDGYLMMFRNGMRMYRGQAVNEYDYRESDPDNGLVTMNTSAGIVEGDQITAIKLNY